MQKKGKNEDKRLYYFNLTEDLNLKNIQFDTDFTQCGASFTKVRSLSFNIPPSGQPLGYLDELKYCSTIKYIFI